MLAAKHLTDKKYTYIAAGAPCTVSIPESGSYLIDTQGELHRLQVDAEGFPCVDSGEAWVQNLAHVATAAVCAQLVLAVSACYVDRVRGPPTKLRLARVACYVGTSIFHHQPRENRNFHQNSHLQVQTARSLLYQNAI